MRRSAALIPLLVFTMLSACGDGEPEAPARVEADPPVERTSLRLGGAPSGLAIGAGGVWVIDGRRDRLHEVDPESLRRRGRPLRVDAPRAITTGEQAVWVLSGSGRVVRVDPRTQRVLRSPTVIADPGGIAAGLGGVWVTSRRDRAVVRLDPRTGRRTDRVRLGGAPADVVIGSGAVWVADAQADTVARIDPASGEVRKRRVAGKHVLGLAAGDGGVFAATSDSEINTRVTLHRVDRAPQGGGVPLASGLPAGLAAGLGSVWVLDAGNLLSGSPARPPALIRVATEPLARAGRPLPIAAQPTDVATGRGAVWITSAGDGTLLRIRPGRVRR